MPVAKIFFSSALTVFTLLGDSDECVDFGRVDDVYDSGFGVSNTSTSTVVSFSGRGRTFGSASFRTPSVSNTNSLRSSPEGGSSCTRALLISSAGGFFLLRPLLASVGAGVDVATPSWSTPLSTWIGSETEGRSLSSTVAPFLGRPRGFLGNGFFGDSDFVGDNTLSPRSARFSSTTLSSASRGSSIAVLLGVVFRSFEPDDIADLAGRPLKLASASGSDSSETATFCRFDFVFFFASDSGRFEKSVGIKTSSAARADRDRLGRGWYFSTAMSGMSSPRSGSGSSWTLAKDVLVVGFVCFLLLIGESVDENDNSSWPPSTSIRSPDGVSSPGVDAVQARLTGEEAGALELGAISSPRIILGEPISDTARFRVLRRAAVGEDGRSVFGTVEGQLDCISCWVAPEDLETGGGMQVIPVLVVTLSPSSLLDPLLLNGDVFIVLLACFLGQTGSSSSLLDVKVTSSWLLLPPYVIFGFLDTLSSRLVAARLLEPDVESEEGNDDREEVEGSRRLM